MSEGKSLNDAVCLVVFCKRPTLFEGKQRLAKTIGAEQGLAFAQSFLGCALEDAREWPGPVVLSPASPDDTAWADRLLDRDCEILAQPPGGLGDRLQTIDQKLRYKGHRKIMFIGTDAPALKPHQYDASRMALHHADVVLCPAADGGVTIMGARTPWPELRHLPWSTEWLGSALRAVCHQHGLITKTISPSYDIDVEADLCRLRKDLSADHRPARRDLYQRLCEFLNMEGFSYA